jgi:hypothetical protein
MAESTLDTMREYVPALPDDNELLVRINGGVQILAGATLLLGIKPRLSAVALAGSLIPTTLAGHSFWEMEGGDAKAHQDPVLEEPRRPRRTAAHRRLRPEQEGRSRRPPPRQRRRPRSAPSRRPDPITTTLRRRNNSARSCWAAAR